MSHSHVVASATVAVLHAGKTELLGMVCEFCAMRVCSKHNYDCMFWDLDARTPGLCTKPFDCGHRINCPGHGSNPGLDRLQQLALERHAAHCPTCMDKLDKGIKLWELVSVVWLSAVSECVACCSSQI